MRRVLAISRALSEESRLRALMAIRNGELCLCQLIELLELAPSTVSKHLTILQEARLVERRKEGRWAYYRLVGDEGPPVAQRAVGWVRESLESSPLIQRDDEDLKRVRGCELEELAACYRS
jgi:DNA-binding transcriptional ArsR family regulator